MITAHITAADRISMAIWIFNMVPSRMGRILTLRDGSLEGDVGGLLQIQPHGWIILTAADESEPLSKPPTRAAGFTIRRQFRSCHYGSSSRATVSVLSLPIPDAR
jgi:hypothetical protein